MTQKPYIFILLLLFAHSLFAQTNEKPPLTQVKIGVTHAPPMIFLEDNKAPDGMIIEFLQTIAELENWKIDWIEGSWSDVMLKAENGELDIMTYIAYTPERSEIFNFSKERFVTGWGQVYSYDDDKITNILDLEDKKVAIVSDDIHGKRFSNLCQEYSVNCLLTKVDDYDSAFDLLINDEVSAVVCGSTVGISYENKFDVTRTSIMFNPSNALFASPINKNKEILNTLDNYISKWRNEPNSPYLKSQSKWMNTIHKKNIPQWLKYLFIGLLSLFVLLVANSLFLRSKVKKHAQLHINHNNQLKQIINLVPHMIYVVNSEGEVVLVNKYASEHFGVTMLSDFTKHQLLQNVPQYNNLFQEDADLINRGKGLIKKELITKNHTNKEVIFNIFKVPFDTASRYPSVLTVGVDITNQKRFQKQIHYMALHDELTKLPNRQLLKAHINKSFKRIAKYKKSAAVLYIDLDFFKNIHDSLGHAAGDKLLNVICKRLKSIAKAKDMVARIGGDEFILHLNDLPSDEDESLNIVKKIARQVKISMSEKILIDKQELYVSASIGVIRYPKDAEDYDQIMQRADIAMYQAKAKGRNNFVIFEYYMEKVIKERHVLVAELRKALKNSEFFLEYQPQIFGDKQLVIGFEALIRWNHPSGKVIYPDKFIPTAEESGLIIQIGNWVLKHVCKQIDVWMKSYKDTPPITVNLSVLQIHNKHMISNLHSLLMKYRVPPRLLELEVTESVMIKHIDKTTETLSQLKKLGVRLSIDDFGTGYSSLSYLKKLPFDKLKIDYSFIKDIVSVKETRTLVKTIIGMTQDLGLEVIAEGVETKEQLDMLTEMGCHNFQGFYFDPSKPPKYIEEKYLR